MSIFSRIIEALNAPDGETIKTDEGVLRKIRPCKPGEEPDFNLCDDTWLEEYGDSPASTVGWKIVN